MALKPQFLVPPSQLMRSGVQILHADGVVLFKLTKPLHSRLEALLNQKRRVDLTELEVAELAGIQELERILTLFNAQLALHYQWSPSQLAALSETAPETAVNTATLLSS